MSEQESFKQDQSTAAHRILGGAEESEQATNPEVDVIEYVLVEIMNEAGYTRLRKFDTPEEAQTFADGENSDPSGGVARVILHPTGQESEFDGS